MEIFASRTPQQSGWWYSGGCQVTQKEEKDYNRKLSLFKMWILSLHIFGSMFRLGLKMPPIYRTVSTKILTAEKQHLHLSSWVEDVKRISSFNGHNKKNPCQHRIINNPRLYLFLKIIWIEFLLKACPVYAYLQTFLHNFW